MIEFDERSLRAAIVSVWGEYGAHVDVFDYMLKRIAEDRAKDELIRTLAAECTMRLDEKRGRFTAWADDYGGPLEMDLSLEQAALLRQILGGSSE